ncbi:hypothetical protein TA3x_002902 [Tundrisphaera sp. TA3]|uniref:hypothetical protein n=1 Tax=Tundrisphaera sp. TA3 TaxID=3435775 RepID=UPI003EBD0225
MLRRRTALMGMMTPLLALLALSTPALGSGVYKYQITAVNAPTGTASSLTQAAFYVTPPESPDVDSTENPIQIDTLDSKGAFDVLNYKPGQASSAFADDSDPTAVPPVALTQRALGFLFSGPGFKTDGSDVLTFTMATDPSYTGPAPTLTPISGLEYIQVKSLGLVVPSSQNGEGSTVNTPEPATLALWSALAGVGLVGSRARRRGRRIPQAA